MMNIHQLKKTFYKTLFPPKFENKKIQALYNFVSQNENKVEHWEIDGLLSQFINIIKNYNESDIQHFFNTINLWNSYYLVIISDKFLDPLVKANVTYDFGNIYAKIFLAYENLDSYFLIDNLEIAVTMYDSKLDKDTLVNVKHKIKLLYEKKLITRQQFDYNMTFINNLTDALPD
jgi:hypothetical protein